MILTGRHFNSIKTKEHTLYTGTLQQIGALSNVLKQKQIPPYLHNRSSYTGKKYDIIISNLNFGNANSQGIFKLDKDLSSCLMLGR